MSTSVRKASNKTELAAVQSFTPETAKFSNLHEQQSLASGAVIDGDIRQEEPSYVRSYQDLLLLTMCTTSSMTGTSISTPTTVASAAPELKPNRLMAAATASSKKLDAPINAEGQAMLCVSPTARLSQYASAEWHNT